jgi:hypothetical protein
MVLEGAALALQVRNDKDNGSALGCGSPVYLSSLKTVFAAMLCSLDSRDDKVGEASAE